MSVLYERNSHSAMRKLTEVEQAKALMREAIDWSVVKWLKEKKRVRRTADQANAALDALELETKNSWNDVLKAAYAHLDSGKGEIREQRPDVPTDSDKLLFAKSVKKACDAAHRARQDAEDTFDEAERELSTRLAREGCKKAIASWELHEHAIRKAESPPG